MALAKTDVSALSLLLLSLSGIIGGCDKFSQTKVSDQRESMIEGVGKSKTVGVVTDPSSGVISAKMSANSPFTQEIRAASDGALKGAVLSFPPGALRVDTEIAVEESIPLASTSLGATLGLNGSITQSSAAIAVLPQVASDPAQPFTVAINLSSDGRLRLLSDNLVILYKVKIFAENKILAGIIPTSALTVEGNVVKFSAPYFGAFQAAYSTEPVTEEIKVEVTTPIQVKREVAALAPLAISGRSTFVVRPGDTVQLRGQNFRSTMTLALGNTPVKDAKVLSDSSASFTVPTATSSGTMALTVDQDGTSQSVALFYSATPLAYPVSTLSPSEVCQGTVYYDGTGTQVSGTKPCVVEACSATKTVACVANDSFPAVDKANLPVDKIRVGTIIATRSGTLGNCTEAGDGCVAVAPFKATDTTNLASKIVSGYTVAGVQGTTVSESHVACTAENSIGCVTTSSFPPVATTGLANKVISTATVAGVAGNVVLPLDTDVKMGVQYGVGGNGLTGSYAGGGAAPANCDASTHTSCVASTAFPSVELAQITASAWNIRAGTSISGVPGQLKTNCRNLVNSQYFNFDESQGTLSNSGHTGGTLLDPWDTVDDFMGWLTTPPPEGAWSTDTLCDSSVWEDVTTADGGSTTAPCDANGTCIYKDKISNLAVSEVLAAASDWPGAFQACDSSTHGGFGQGVWRLPTQKELMSLYEHGIASVASANFIPLADMAAGFWSASSDVSTTSQAWKVSLASGATSSTLKTDTLSVICIK